MRREFSILKMFQISTIFELENTDEELNKTEDTDTEDGSSSTKTTRHRKTAAVLSTLLLTEEIFFFRKWDLLMPEGGKTHRVHG